MSLPHITNSQAGRNKWDPVYKNMFEVYFTLPEALRAQFGRDEQLITEHVIKVTFSGIDKGVEVTNQKFMGTTRSYLNSKMDDTSIEISIDLTLNLREGLDAYIYKLFKAWKNLGYDLSTGATTLKTGYCADWLKVSIANRANDVIREIVFKDVIMKGGIEGWEEMDYSQTGDLVQLTVKFQSDWWTDVSV